MNLKHTNFKYANYEGQVALNGISVCQFSSAEYLSLCLYRRSIYFFIISHF
jgi:hypothetical protein